MTIRARGITGVTIRWRRCTIGSTSTAVHRSRYRSLRTTIAFSCFGSWARGMPQNLDFGQLCVRLPTGLPASRSTKRGSQPLRSAVYPLKLRNLFLLHRQHSIPHRRLPQLIMTHNSTSDRENMAQSTTVDVRRSLAETDNTHCTFKPCPPLPSARVNSMLPCRPLVEFLLGIRIVGLLLVAFLRNLTGSCSSF